MEAEDEAVTEAEPARPKRKLIATLQVITGVTDLGSFNPGRLSMSAHLPAVGISLGGEPAVCAGPP